MKKLRYIVLVLIVLATLVFAQPSWAAEERPKYERNPDYIEVTKELNKFLMVKGTQARLENYTPEEIQKKIDELEFKKYILETGIDWGQCRNETGKMLAVYGPKPEKSGSSYEKAIYFLADGQTTKNQWDCDGVYLSNDVKATYLTSGKQGQNLGGPVAVKIADGTKLVVKTNPETAAIEFNIPPTKVFKSGEVNWFIPNVSQSLIDTQVSNAPTN